MTGSFKRQASGLAVFTAMMGSAAMLQAEVLAAGDETEPRDLGTITLSALRAPIEISRSGMAVSVIEGEALARDGRVKVADVLASLPGVSLTEQGPFGNATVMRIRGLNWNYIGVYVDGIRIDDPSAVGVSSNLGALLSTDVGRIEVLRGSHSALWGGSAVAGVINITTLGELEDGTHQKLRVEGGTHGTGTLAWGLSHKDERLELAINATRHQTDGYSSWAGGRELDGAEANRLSFSGRYRLSEALALGLSGFVQTTRQDYDGTDASWTFTDRDNVQTRKENGLRAFGELQAGGADHLFEISRYEIEREMNEEGAISRYEGERLQLGWKAHARLAPTLGLTTGLEWSRETVTSDSVAAGSSSRLAGAYAQLDWAPRAGLDVNAAVRVDHSSDFGSFTSGRLAFAWELAEGTTLRGAMARGFRTPSLDELYGDYGYFIGNPDLQPETSRSFELGLDHAFGSGAQISATAFRIAIDDRIASDPGVIWPATGTLTNLPGGSVSKGLEVALAAEIMPGLDLSASWTWTDARDPDGQAMLRVPRHDLSLRLDADLNDSLSGHLSLSHQSGRRDQHINTFARIDMPDVTLVGMGLSQVINDTTSADLRIENLFDETWQSTHGYATAGRTLHIGLSTRF